MRADCPKLRPEVGPPTKRTANWRTAKPKPSLNPVGGAPRGECSHRPARTPKLRPEVGPPTEKHRRWAYRKTQTLTQPCGRRAPRRMQPQACQNPKASPRGRASHRKAPPTGIPQNPNSHSTLWEARPAANAGHRPARTPKLRPEVGPPTKSTADGHAAKPKPSLNLVGGAPRGECRPQACQPSKLRPEVGPPTKKHRRRATCKTQTLTQPAGGKPRGERRPQACHDPQSFAPRSGLPQESTSDGHTAKPLTQPRGRRAPRRTQACRRCRNRLESRSFRSTKAR